MYYQKNWKTYLTTPDNLCLWWHERDACKIQTEQGELNVTLAGDWPMVVKLPAKTKRVLVDGNPVTVTTKTIGGIPYRLVTVKGKGTHTVQY